VREWPAKRTPADESLADRMLERLAAGDYPAALMAAEALLSRRPRDADALDCAEMSRGELRALHAARLGGALHRVPTIAGGPEAISALALDTTTALVLSRVDGSTTLGEIAFTSGIVPDDALRVLSELHLRGVIAVGG
jgi:hypothetical protein